MKIKIYYVSGCEGDHIAIGDIRICGPKAWGGGKILKEWITDTVTISDAIKYAKEMHEKNIKKGINHETTCN